MCKRKVHRMELANIFSYNISNEKTCITYIYNKRIVKKIFFFITFSESKDKVGTSQIVCWVYT